MPVLAVAKPLSAPDQPTLWRSLIISNATGCSSIYGGNLPTTPWSQNAAGRGPPEQFALEDNAEFGLGMRLTLDHRANMHVFCWCTARIDR